MNSELQRKLQLKINEVSRRITYIENSETISSSKAQRCRQRLIAEIHTLNYAIGKSKNIDSDEWFEELEKGDK